MTNSTFRFLDLPKEVRLIIYECIPITTRHHVWEDSARHTFWGEFLLENTITLVTKSISIAILLVSSSIYDECKPIIDRKLKALQDEPLRLIVDEQSLLTLTHHQNDEGRHINSFLWCLEDFGKFTAGQEHSQRWEEKEVELSDVKFNSKGPQSIRLIEFLDLMTQYREKRSPRSSLIAVRLKGFYGEVVTVAGTFLGPVQDQVFGFPAPTWTYHPSMQDVQQHECNVKEDFTETIRICRENPDFHFIKLAEPGTPEEWARDWEEGEWTTSAQPIGTTQ